MLNVIGDNPSKVAQEFASKNNLSEKMYEKLNSMLKQQMSGILSRINEEDDIGDKLKNEVEINLKIIQFII